MKTSRRAFLGALPLAAASVATAQDSGQPPIELNDPCKATQFNVLTDSEFILLTDRDGKNLGTLKFKDEIIIRLRKVTPR